ncbi:hypothetical protein HG1285_08201 [Hydrogenivirga sp. 128-5-R1-1]|nr:hypothetical protein HG1285_08201 [Hydrogenivirga sp. 128-5-R1-1]
MNLSDPSVGFPIAVIGMVSLAIIIFIVMLVLDKGSDEE